MVVIDIKRKLLNVREKLLFAAEVAGHGTVERKIEWQLSIKRRKNSKEKLLNELLGENLNDKTF